MELSEFWIEINTERRESKQGKEGEGEMEKEAKEGRREGEKKRGGGGDAHTYAMYLGDMNLSVGVVFKDTAA